MEGHMGGLTGCLEGGVHHFCLNCVDQISVPGREGLSVGPGYGGSDVIYTY